MRWLIKYIVSTLPFLSTACSGDRLDLDPFTSMTSDNVAQPSEDTKAALDKIYRIASEHSYYGDNYLYCADYRGEDIQARIDRGPGRRVSSYYLFNVAADDTFSIARVWNQPYITIRQANGLIEKIDNGSVQTFDAQEIAHVKAEALVMHGLTLFDLARLFGISYTLDNGASLGMPIGVKTELPTHRPSCSTVAECYSQVVKDLTGALPNLVTTEFGNHQNVWSMKALLSRIYLYMNGSENALKYAQEVVNNEGLYTLFTHDRYTSIWGKNFDSKSLFEFYFTPTEPSGGSGGEGAPMVCADNVKGWNNLVLMKDSLNLLGKDPNDVRHALCRLPQEPDEDILPTGSTGHPKYLTKYPGRTEDVLTGNPQDNDLYIIRLSEIYLNTTEMTFKLGKRNETLGYLSQVVDRANPDKSVSDSELSLERILEERRKELVGEGHTFFDYMRNNIPIVRKGGWHLLQLPTDAQVINASDPWVAFPIPQSEVGANPNIVQNKR